MKFQLVLFYVWLERFLVSAYVPRQRFTAGAFGDLQLNITSLAPSPLHIAGRVRVKPQGWECGSEGSSVMDPGVQPSCAAGICRGPSIRDESVVTWRGLRLVHTGVFQLCWCQPNASCAVFENRGSADGCCGHDANFSMAVGEVEVVGPDWFALAPLTGEVFRMKLSGIGIPSSGSQVLLRFLEADGGGGQCGQRLTPAERKAFSARPAVDKDKFLPQAPFAYPVSSPDIDGAYVVTYFVLQLTRNRPFRICWCVSDCRLTKAQAANYNDPSIGLISEEDFAAEVGAIYPTGPSTESPIGQFVLAGTPFLLRLTGTRLSIYDRILIVDSSLPCGHPQAHQALTVSSFVCGRGTTPCVQSPVVSSPPTSLDSVNDANTGQLQQEAWYPTHISEPGIFRLCWCVDTTWNPITLSSQGFCGSDDKFIVDAGYLVVQGLFTGQSFQCTAFSPCNVTVLSQIPFGEQDQLLIVAPPEGSSSSLASNCGRGTSGLAIPLLNGWNATDTSNRTRDPSLKYAGNFFIPFSGTPGKFRICYCRESGMGPCDEAQVFGQSAGVLNINVAANQIINFGVEVIRVCTSFFPCSFNISGLWAMQIIGSDAFLAFPADVDCGTDFDDRTNPHFSLGSKQQLPSGWFASFQHDQGILYRAGDYRLCYCLAAVTPNGECRSPSNFKNDVGLLKVIGLRSKANFTCPSRATCFLQISSWRAAPSDAVRLLDSTARCGDPDPTNASLALGIERNPAVTNLTEADDTAVVQLIFNLGRVQTPGLRRVCYCASVLTATGACRSPTDFVQEAGFLSVTSTVTKAPTATNSTVVQPTSATDSMWGIVLDQMFNCLAFKPCTMKVLSTLAFGAQDSAIVVMPTKGAMTTFATSCGLGTSGLQVALTRTAKGSGNSTTYFADFDLTSSGQPGIYRICFCKKSVMGQCDNAAAFKQYAGALNVSVAEDQVLNVTQAVQVCVATRMCHLTIPGIWGMQTMLSDQFLAFPAGVNCGKSFDNTQSPLFFLKSKLQSLSGLWSADFIQDGHMFYTAGDYRLCYCLAALTSRSICESLAGFRYDAGSLQMIGVRTKSKWSCLQGSSCAVNMTGWRVMKGDVVRLISKSAVCGDYDPKNISLAPGFDRNPSFARKNESLTNGEVTLVFDLGLARLLGDWRVCLCVASFSQEGLCRNSTDFAQEVGTVSISTPPSGAAVRNATVVLNVSTLPPSPIYVRQPFQVAVDGVALDWRDRVLLLSEGPAAVCGSNVTDIPVTLNVSGAMLISNNASNSSGNFSNAAGNGSSLFIFQAAAASCSLVDGNGTRVICGDGRFSLSISEPGIYRICYCAALPTMQLGSNDLIQSAVRRPCERLSDFKLMPRNGSLVEIHAVVLNFSDTGNVSSNQTAINIAVATADAPTDGNRDFMLTIGLSAAAGLYVLAMTGAWCLWRRRRKVTIVGPSQVQQQLKRGSSLVANATQRAWEAYSRTIEEAVVEAAASSEERPATASTLGEGMGPSYLARAITPGSSVTRPGTADSKARNITPRSGTGGSQARNITPRSLTPPGTGGSQASQSTTCSAESRMSLLRVALNNNLHVPPPRPGGCFLDMTLTGKRTGSPASGVYERSPALHSWRDVPLTEDAGGTPEGSAKSSRETSPSAGDDDNFPETEKKASGPGLPIIITRPSLPSEQPPSLVLPVQEQKSSQEEPKKQELKPVKEEAAKKEEPAKKDADVSPIDRSPVTRAVPAAPALPPPALPEKSKSVGAGVLSAPPKKDPQPQQTPRQATPRDEQRTPRAAPQLPTKQPPTSVKLLVMPPPPCPPPQRTTTASKVELPPSTDLPPDVEKVSTPRPASVEPQTLEVPSTPQVPDHPAPDTPTVDEPIEPASPEQETPQPEAPATPTADTRRSETTSKWKVGSSLRRNESKISLRTGISLRSSQTPTPTNNTPVSPSHGLQSPMNVQATKPSNVGQDNTEDSKQPKGEPLRSLLKPSAPVGRLVPAPAKSEAQVLLPSVPESAPEEPESQVPSPDEAKQQDGLDMIRCHEPQPTRAASVNSLVSVTSSTDEASPNAPKAAARGMSLELESLKSSDDFGTESATSELARQKFDAADAQERLRQEWYERLAADPQRLEAERKRVGASLRRPGGSSLRPGTSLRAAASARATPLTQSQAPSRGSVSPVNSPRDSTQFEQGPSLRGTAGFMQPGPQLGVPTWAAGPGPATGPVPMGAGPMLPGPSFTHSPGPALGPGPPGTQNQSRQRDAGGNRPLAPSWAFFAP